MGVSTQIYNPVLAWANQQFDVKFNVSNSIFGAAQQPETHQAVRHYLQGAHQNPTIANVPPPSAVYVSYEAFPMALL